MPNRPAVSAFARCLPWLWCGRSIIHLSEKKTTDRTDRRNPTDKPDRQGRTDTTRRMPPPAKKRKTEAAVAGSDASSTALSIEMIGRVASFANYGDDLMSICKAVGPKDSGIIRYACLRNNMGFLQYTLENFTAKIRTPRRARAFAKTIRNVDAWVEVNTDWRKHCTLERTEDEEISTCLVRENDEDDDGPRPVVLSTNPLILFNNPSVAIELGLTPVLKYLVEEVGVDINASTWCCYSGASMDTPTKTHLVFAALTYAESLDDTSSFDYLLSREETDVHAPGVSGGGKCVWERMYEHDTCSCRNFRDVIEHSSFEPNRNSDSVVDMPIFFAFLTGAHTVDENNPASTNLLIRKFKVLLDVGADPELVLGTAGGQTPLVIAKLILGSLEESGINPPGVQVGRQMIAAMEEKIAGGGGSD